MKNMIQLDMFQELKEFASYIASHPTVVAIRTWLNKPIQKNKKSCFKKPYYAN